VSDILSNVSADVVLAELTNQIASLSRENAILKAMTQKLRQQLVIQEQELNALRATKE
jgi:cell division protein FtsB